MQMDFPQKPGCYIFKNNKKILYIGKAKNLKKRIDSYFNKNLFKKTKIMFSKVNEIDFITTKNEIEAFILENNLIKKYKPKYNINLKDSKGYSYFLITDEKFPRLIIARQKGKNKRYFGPFVDAKKRDELLKFIKKTFKIRTCKKLPKKECLRYHIGLCLAPCIKKISEEEYLQIIKKIKKILNGDIKSLILKMNEEMKIYSKKNEFEKAKEIRDKINSLNYLIEKQNIEKNKTYDEDIINYIEKNDNIYLMVFNIYKGALINKKEYVFKKINENFLEEFISRFYLEEKQKIPKEIILPKKVNEKLLILLSKKANKKIKFIYPIKGRKKKLSELVKENINLVFFSSFLKLKQLKKNLNLKKIPKIIECFDISHLTGTNVVGSMVVFENGIKNPKRYRRFKIKTENKIDDFASINEIVKRRYKKLNEKKPDLILIDGGIGQLNSAKKALEELNLKIEIISIAKKQEEIYTLFSKKPIKLNDKNTGLLFLREIRDSAHNFAIKYNRLLRKFKIK